MKETLGGGRSPARPGSPATCGPHDTREQDSFSSCDTGGEVPILRGLVTVSFAWPCAEVGAGPGALCTPTHLPHAAPAGAQFSQSPHFTDPVHPLLKKKESSRELPHS